MLPRKIYLPRHYLAIFDECVQCTMFFILNQPLKNISIFFPFKANEGGCKISHPHEGDDSGGLGASSTTGIK